MVSCVVGFLKVRQPQGRELVAVGIEAFSVLKRPTFPSLALLAWRLLRLVGVV